MAAQELPKPYTVPEGFKAPTMSEQWLYATRRHPYYRQVPDESYFMLKGCAALWETGMLSITQYSDCASMMHCFCAHCHRYLSCPLFIQRFSNAFDTCSGSHACEQACKRAGCAHPFALKWAVHLCLQSACALFTQVWLCSSCAGRARPLCSGHHIAGGGCAQGRPQAEVRSSSCLYASSIHQACVKTRDSSVPACMSFCMQMSVSKLAGLSCRCPVDLCRGEKVHVFYMLVNACSARTHLSAPHVKSVRGLTSDLCSTCKRLICCEASLLRWRLVHSAS